MGGGSSPDPDPNIGIAALKSAETGQQMLDWMQGQAEVTNRWAEEDRDRYKTVFEPMQDMLIQEAQEWDSPGRRAQRADQAAADVELTANQQQRAQERQAMAMGVDPRSGRFQEASARAGLDKALAKAGAKNLERRNVENEGYAKRANVVNLGSGFAVNPGTSMNISNNAGSSGFQGAIQGLGQQGSLLNQDFQNRLGAWQANQGALGAVGGALGTVAGALFGSSKDIKENKTEARGALRAVENMPVEEWSYKEGHGDNGAQRHVGPYAEDFQRETGQGNGKSIPVVDAIGLTMGAIKELSAKVDSIAQNIGPVGAIREAA